MSNCRPCVARNWPRGAFEQQAGIKKGLTQRGGLERVPESDFEETRGDNRKRNSQRFLAAGFAAWVALAATAGAQVQVRDDAGHSIFGAIEQTVRRV